MSFIHTTAVVGKKISLATWQLYFFDVVMLLCVVGLFFDLRHLKAFDGHADQVRMFWGILTTQCGFGLYGFRIATYIAIARKCRMPQVAEWWACLLGMAFFIMFAVFGGHMLKAYASTRGYTYCFEDAFRNPEYVFERRPLACPPEPSFQEKLNRR